MKTPIILFLGLAPLAAAAQEAGAPLPDKLDLKSALLYAVDHSFTIREAREQIRLQDGVIMQVKAQEIPNVSASGAYQRNSEGASTSYPPSTAYWSLEAKVTEMLYAGGGLDASVKNARLLRDAAAAYDLQTAIDTALLDVRTKFYNVLLAREQVRVQEENVQLFGRQLGDTQNQFHAGSVSNFEVLRARVALANAQPDLITARNNLRIGIEQLRQALGVPTGAAGDSSPFPEVVGDLDFAPETYQLDAALQSARDHRPELMSLAKHESAGEESITTARSNYYPNLSAYGGYEYGAENLVGAGGIPGGTYTGNGWLLGVQSAWSIFDGRATAGRVRQAQAQLEQSRLSVASEELSIDVEVRQAFSSYQEAAELVDATKQTVGQAEEALRLANERYKAGSATQLDVLTSQVALTQARTNELQSNYTYLVAVAALRKAMGLGDAVVGQ